MGSVRPYFLDVSPGQPRRPEITPLSGVTTKLSQITPASVPPATTDQIVGVVGGANDRLYTLSQIAAAVGAAGGANPSATASDVAVNGVAATFMRSDAAPAVQLTSTTRFGLCKPDGSTITALSGVLSVVGGGATGSNPTATAGSVAVNGVAPTFMRSDAAPAVQLTSPTQFGLCKPDGSTIAATGGVISAVGGGATGSNPTATAGSVAVNGVAPTFMRSDAAPAVQLTSPTQFGLCKPDGSTITALSGVLSAPGGGALQIGVQPVTGGVSGQFLYNNAGTLGSAAIAGGTDPLFLTQGLGVTATNPTVFGDPNYRRGVNVNVTYDQLNSNPGFTDQVAAAVQLNFKAGLNIYNASGPATVLAKYTPVALNVGGDYPGAGEKFVLAMLGNFWSMGDSFLMSGNSTYAGGPIAGDEGQGYSPAMQFTQPNSVARETVTAVVRTTYSATITSPVTASQNAQNIAVSTTVGANVGDWVVINQAVPSNNSAIWAMQILAINPGVSINGVLPMNCTVGTTITPALCLNLDGGGGQFGEGRTLVNLSGASYSTGTISSISGGAVNGSGVTWSNTMVGGNALNIGAIYFDVDTLTTTSFSPGTPCRSIYQIITIVNPTQLGLFSNSVAADASYRGRGMPPATGFTYKIIPAARVLKINPVGSPSFTVVCETSTHTWTVGDTVECAFCPFPDVHGWDFRVGEWTAGGNRRSVIFISNPGARMFDAGIEFSGQPPYIGNLSNLEVDGFSFDAAVKIQSCRNPIQIYGATSSDGTTYKGGPAITLNGSFGDGSDTAIYWSANGATITPVNPNHGFDFNMTNNAIIRSVGQTVNPDGNRPQMSMQGYLQLCDVSSNKSYLRMGGSNTPGASITGTFDLGFTSFPGFVANNTLQFYANLSGPTVTPLFGVTAGGSNWPAGANVPPATAATAGVNVPSQVMQMTANVWDGSASQFKSCSILAQPDSLSATNTTISMQFQVWDQVNNNPSRPNTPMSLSSLGLLTFGINTVTGGDKRATLDPSNLTAPRTVKFMDTSGDLSVISANTTGAGSAALGANCPAVTPTAPYTWEKKISHDGSTVYSPVWK